MRYMLQTAIDDKDASESLTIVPINEDSVFQDLE